MTGDWQSWAAPAVVLLTAILMGYRLFARRKSGCGGSCGCSASDPKQRLSATKRRD